MLEAVCQTKVGLIGTNQNLIDQQALPAQRTTPDAYTLQSLLARMEEAGCTHVVMEVSSHALALRRTAGLWFQAGIFTNLTRDHLDFHGTMEAYRKAKGLLFQQCQTGIFNLDDGAGRQFAQTAPCQAVTFGETQGQAQVLAREIRLYPDRVSFQVHWPQGSCPVTLPIPGALLFTTPWGSWPAAWPWGCPWTRRPGPWPRFPGSRAGWRWCRCRRPTRCSSTTPILRTPWRRSSPPPGT
ncbi:MAG: Mur ligase family protein [Evtepia gabavorous]